MSPRPLQVAAALPVQQKSQVLCPEQPAPRAQEPGACHKSVELSIRVSCLCVVLTQVPQACVSGTALCRVYMSPTGSSVIKLLSGTNGASETGFMWYPQDQGQCFSSHKAKAEGQHLFSCQPVPSTLLATATPRCSLCCFPHCDSLRY